MPLRTIHQATTQRLEILDAEGHVDAELLPAELTDAQLVRLLELMLRMRAFDDKALNLQRQGRMGTYGSLRGQEAAQAGLALALTDDDWLVPSIREQGVLEARGFPMHHFLAFCKGDERANRMAELRSMPPCIAIGDQLPHGAGLGLALKLRHDPGVAVTFAGDGATSQGDFHEALNFAGVFGARTLFFIQNNGWAISVPFARQTAAASIAQRAHAYGLAGIQVDGNDVLAVYAASRDALAHVRAGHGPYLLEALTYRMGSHTTADDHTRYRSAEDLELWRTRDPIDRMRTFLVGRGLWSESQEQVYRTRLSAEVEAEVAQLEARTPAPATDIFDHMFASITPQLRAQREALLAELRDAQRPRA